VTEGWPLVSVVIPVHNGARFLAAALASVLGQDYPRLEVVVVDDGSTDGSAEIARAHAEVQVVSQPNAGVAAARNAGILRSTGTLLAFLDQDDTWTPGKVRIQVSYLLAHPDTGYVVAGQRMVLDPGATCPPWIPRELLEHDHAGYFPGTLMARRSVFDRVGLYRPAAPPAESADWFVRARDAGVAMAVLPETLLLKRLHDGNQSLDIARVRSGVLQALKASVDRKRAGASATRPLVSVVLPVHNGERYLEDALVSVLAQTYQPAEVIVVDDGSADASADIAASLGVRCIRQPRGGTAAARNAGLAAARGACIAHMDADDLWEPRKLELQVAALAGDPGLDAVGGHLVEFFSPELDAESRTRMRPPRGPMPGHLLQAMLIRRESHERVGPFETRWQVAQDMSWYMRAVEAGFRIRVLPDLVLKRRLHGRNKGIVERDRSGQRLEILKAALDRRRGMTEPS
jgi:glycosyltransferase involved in cell wall biosynthesis